MNLPEVRAGTVGATGFFSCDTSHIVSSGLELDEAQKRERLLIDSAQRALLSPKMWCTWGRRHQGNLPAMLVGDVDYGRDARDRQHGLWKALRAAARAEATRAQAKLRDGVGKSLVGKIEQCGAAANTWDERQNKFAL